MPNWGGGLSGAASGYSTGSMFGGPIGGAIGAGVGGLFGLFKKKKKPPIAGGGEGGNVLDPEKIGSQYQNIASTGGYSPEDLSNIRSRAVSPIRSAYAGAQREVGRQRALQGGYSPNFTAATAKMAREQSQSMADANIGIESEIAQMIQQGKLKGLEGLSSLYRTKQSTPSDYQRKLGSIGGTMGLIGQVGGALMGGFGGRGGGGGFNPDLSIGGGYNSPLYIPGYGRA